jgi:hypothetical protein
MEETAVHNPLPSYIFSCGTALQLSWFSYFYCIVFVRRRLTIIYTGDRGTDLPPPFSYARLEMGRIM